MTFRACWTPEAIKTFEELHTAASNAAARRARDRSAGKGGTKASKQEGLFKQVAKTIELLLSNPRHNSLETHEYSSLEHPFDPNGKVFEAYAQNRTPGAYRIFWCYGPERGDITLIAITPHP